jgi:acetolactate synthase regulatory subunit
MAYTVDLRVRADLLGIARVFRLLRRHAVRAPQVAFEHGTDGGVARLCGTLANSRRAPALARALASTPAVTHAAILDETRVLAEICR